MSSTTWLHAAQQCINMTKCLFQWALIVVAAIMSFGTQAVWCVSKKLMTSLFPSFLNDQHEVSKSSKTARQVTDDRH